MYLTYGDYQTMGGTLDEASFSEFEFEAETIVNWYTFNRLRKFEAYPEELGRCMFALIKLAQLKAEALMLGSQTKTTTVDGVTTTVTTSAAIASQSNDGVSISYNTVGASDAFRSLSTTQRGGELESTVQRYLQGVVDSLGRKILYRGVYADE